MLAGYRRVSAVGGRKHLRSPEDQAEEIETWAKRYGHQVHILPPELDGKSDNPDRPIFREAIDGIKAGRFTGIVVAYMSRAGRDLRLMLDLWDEVEKAGGVSYSARENIDSSTTAGRLQRNIRASIDQAELEERREGFEHARKHAVAAGVWQRRQTPRGYDRDPDTRKLVVNDQAEQVRQAARDILAGTPTIEVARNLGMTGNGLRYMLRNRVYLGELKVGDHVNPEAHDPILDPETFAALAVRLDGPKRGPLRHSALLARLVRCAACGHVMTRSGDGKAFNYVCTVNHSGGTCPEPTSISCRKLDSHIDRIAEHELARLQIERTGSDRAAELRAETLAAQRELSAYLEAVDAAGLGPEAAEGMRRRRDRVRAAEAAERAELSRVPILAGVEDPVAAYRSLDTEGRNHVLRSLLAAIAVRRGGKGNPPITDRVLVVAYGADVPGSAGPPERGMGIRPFWPDGDPESLIGFPGVQ